ncbi:unnamed protein product, partial [Didymodactylos carnosus]
MSTDAIEAWKCHQLRAVNQDLSSQELLQDLPANSVYILTDWAMKWLPEKYMKPQEDFFAKRGLSWHISVVVKKVTSTTTKSTHPKNTTGNDESENEETSDEEAEEEEMSAQNSYTHTVYVHAMDH